MSSQDGQVTDEPTSRWVYEIEGPVNTPPTVAERTIYIGSRDTDLHAVDAATGTER